MQHILSTQQFLDKRTLAGIFRLADKYERLDALGKSPRTLRDRVLACVFYEPSTRTRFSFESAMLKLGGQVVSTESAGYFSSAVKGETLEDTIRIISGYADAIVLRHSEQGAAARSARVAGVPIINAGDGNGEHPTQALLDMYTISKEIGRTDNLKVGLTGDLLYGRTVHSLTYLLSLGKNIELFLVSLKELRLPETYRKFLTTHNVKFHETESLADAIPQVDVLYMTRIQKERLPSEEMHARVKDAFVLTPALMHNLGKKAIVMHPLPRVNEISAEVDSDPRAAYFRQARNGLYIRMALLSMLFKKQLRLNG
jgi:aspartate carbamoyltransferase catalytic subunit